MTRVSILISEPARGADAETIGRRLRSVARGCSIDVHTIDPLSAVPAACRADVVLYVGGETAATRAALVALRERAGFTTRFLEPEFARAWFTTDHARSLFVLGALPGAWAGLALALELGVGDHDAAQRVRAGDPPLRIAS